MKSKYVVLRMGAIPAAADGRRGLRRDVYAVPTDDDGAEAARPIRVDVVDVERAEVRNLSAERGTVAVAPAIPMKLIEPVQMAGPAAPDEGLVAWGIKAVRADTSSFTGAGTVVAVLDTGIEAGHEAFAGVELVRRNFTDEGNDDSHGHGTHCAGTIFGRTTAGMRIGVAPGVKKALIGKVLGSQGGSSDQIAAAIQWAVQEGAHVISMSLGMDFPGLAESLKQELPPELATSRALEAYRLNVQLFEKLAGYVKARGEFGQPTILVAAAGNESRRDVDPRFEIAVSPPAVADGILSVAALARGAAGWRIAPFSNTGAKISGPGVEVMSARLGGGLKPLNGTSMATPHVAGVAALWVEHLAAKRALDGYQLMSRLTGSASTDGIEAGFDPFEVGVGMVSAPQK